jgi:hypothetical protein
LPPGTSSRESSAPLPAGFSFATKPLRTAAPASLVSGFARIETRLTWWESWRVGRRSRRITSPSTATGQSGALAESAAQVGGIEQ